MKPFSYRRVARECVIQALYSAELGQSSIDDSLEMTFNAFSDAELIGDLTADVDYPEATLDLVFRFARQMAAGIWQDRVVLDREISRAIPDYDFPRLALVDKNVLRLGTYELANYDYIPPAVTINEAIELAKKYSTAESGRFVNGVLATMLKQSPKLNYDQKTAPKDPDLGEIERIYREPKVVLDEETVEAESEEGKIARRYGWTIKQE